jgi:murein DD-endopeptidase MepM/ murein hydrolase activator NlpD
LYGVGGNRRQPDLWTTPPLSTGRESADPIGRVVPIVPGVRLLRWVLTGLVCLVLAGTSAGTALAASGVPPLAGPIIRAFDPPDEPWLAGHRGIDLLAAAASPVVAVLPGVVAFAGRIAGRGVVVVSHGDTRTTYEPVSATVRVGDEVEAGQQLGILETSDHCSAGSCLHLGWLRGQTYLDPSGLFDAGGLRLLPDGSAGLADRLAAARQAALGAGSSPGLLSRPVPGGIGSGFGMRFHPILHRWRMHAGVDLHADCGDPIHAAAAGVVTGRSYDSASGNRLTVDHGVVGGHRLVTIYMHASSWSVRVGQRVRRGELLGRVGDTGWATGCHLHLSVRLDGRLVDPAGFL